MQTCLNSDVPNKFHFSFSEKILLNWPFVQPTLELDVFQGGNQRPYQMHLLKYR